MHALTHALTHSLTHSLTTSLTYAQGLFLAGCRRVIVQAVVGVGLKRLLLVLARRTLCGTAAAAAAIAIDPLLLLAIVLTSR